MQADRPPPGEGWISGAWYGLVYGASMGTMGLGFSLRVDGRGHVPRKGPVLLVANHQSFLDPVLVGLAAPRVVHFLARRTLFPHPFVGRLIRSLQAVPIDHEGLGIEGLRAVLRELEAGRAVAVFPEGERTHDGRMQPLRPGVRLLVQRAQVPVVPVGIAGAYEAWPRSRPLPVPAPLFLPAGRGTLAVSVGRPLGPAALLKGARKGMLETLSRAIREVQARAERLRRRG